MTRPNDEDGLQNYMSGSENGSDDSRNPEDRLTAELGIEEGLSQEEENKRLRAIIRVLRDEKWDAINKGSGYRQTLERCKPQIKTLKDNIEKHQFSIKKIREMADKQTRLWKTELKTLGGLFMDEIREKFMTSSDTDGCPNCGDYTALTIQFENLQSDLARMDQMLKASNDEKQKLQEKLSTKGVEHKQLHIHVRSKDSLHIQAINKMQKLLDENDKQLTEMAQELNKIKRLYDSHLKMEADIQAKTTRTDSEVELLSSFVRKNSQQMEAISAERDDYKAQIEAMKRDLERKEHERALLIEQETSRLEQDLKVKEEDLKLQFQQDLSAEQDKLQKLLEQYVTDYRTNEGKFMGHLKSVTTNFKAKVDELKKELDSCKRGAGEKEAKYKAEIEDLLQQIEELKATTDSLEKAAGSKPNSVVPKSCPHQTCISIKDHDNEVHLLEEVVERECSERIRLTDCLREAQRELKFLRKQKSKDNMDAAMKSHQLKALSTEDSSSSTLAPEMRRPKKLESLAIYKKQKTSSLGSLKPAVSDSALNRPFSDAGMIDFEELRKSVQSINTKSQADGRVSSNMALADSRMQTLSSMDDGRIQQAILENERLMSLTGPPPPLAIKESPDESSNELNPTESQKKSHTSAESQEKPDGSLPFRPDAKRFDKLKALAETRFGARGEKALHVPRLRQNKLEPRDGLKVNVASGYNNKDDQRPPEVYMGGSKIKINHSVKNERKSTGKPKQKAEAHDREYISGQTTSSTCSSDAGDSVHNVFPKTRKNKLSGKLNSTLENEFRLPRIKNSGESLPAKQLRNSLKSFRKPNKIIY